MNYGGNRNYGSSQNRNSRSSGGYSGNGYPKRNNTRSSGNYSRSSYSDSNYTESRSPRPSDNYSASGYPNRNNTRSPGSRSRGSYSNGNYTESRSPRPSDNYSASGYPNRNNTRSSGSRSRGSYSNGNYTESRSARPSDNYSASGYPKRNNTRSSGSRSRGSYSNDNYTESRSPRSSGSYSRNGYSHNGRTSSAKSYRKTKNSDNMPISVFIGIGITAIAVIALIISVSANSGKSKNRQSSYDDSIVSQSDASGTTVIEMPEDENESDESASSRLMTQSFVGTWYKTDVPQSQKAEFIVTMQYEDSFEFRLEIWNEDKSVAINETAFYIDETHAQYSPKQNSNIIFERGTDYINITHNGSNSSIGIGKKYNIDGKFTLMKPDYASEATATSTQTSNSTYDYNIYKSDATVSALSGTLSSDDYALYKDMMKNGLKSPIDYERTTDKNGHLVNVDSQLNAVKYYAHSNSNGYDMILICSDNANFYLLFYNNEEIIYYTNDKKFSSKMPESFQAVAKAKDIKPTFR